MKKIIAFLMIFGLSLSFTACKNSNDVMPIDELSSGTSATSSKLNSTGTFTENTNTENIPSSSSERTNPPTTQHVHQYYKKTILPTCESSGYTQYTCSCGHTYKDNYVNAIGHNWNGATCTSAKTCKNCGKIDGEPLTHNYVNGVCTYCNCYDYLYVELAQDGFKYLEAKYGITTYDVISITGGEINGSPAVMLYGTYKGNITYFTYNDVTGRVTAWSIGSVEYTEYFRMDVKSILEE